VYKRVIRDKNCSDAVCRTLPPPLPLHVICLPAELDNKKPRNHFAGVHDSKGQAYGMQSSQEHCHVFFFASSQKKVPSVPLRSFSRGWHNFN